MCDNKSILAAQEDLGASTDVVSTDDEATPSIAGDSPDEDADEILFVDIIPADESANGNEVAQNAPAADEQSVEASKVDPTPEENDKEAKKDEDNEIPFHEWKLLEIKRKNAFF